MDCDKCGNETSVTDSRPAEIYGIASTRRRRKCLSCKERNTTYELSLEKITRLKTSAFEGKFNEHLQSSISSTVREILDQTLREDFDSKVTRYDTMNRARKTRHIQKIPDSFVIK